MRKDFRIVVITCPDFMPGEAEAVTALLEAGAWRVHVRKPEADAAEVSDLIEAVPERLRRRLSLHDCHELALRYALGGVHLNSRNPLPPEGFTGFASRSCHSFGELSGYAGKYDYMFLSPVFDSISKPGYGPRFSLDVIRAQAEAGVVDDRVFALGGVSPDNIGLLPGVGFGGAAVLGCIWKQFGQDHNVRALTGRFRSLMASVEARP